jgi:hypothetical protein
MVLVDVARAFAGEQVERGEAQVVDAAHRPTVPAVGDDVGVGLPPTALVLLDHRRQRAVVTVVRLPQHRTTSARAPRAAEPTAAYWS